MKKDLKGGGLDDLTEENSLLFSNTDEAADAFIKILSNYENYQFDTLPIEKTFSETYTKEKLQNNIEFIFKKHNVPLKGPIDLDHLNKKLPSHYITLPRYLRKPSPMT